MVFNILKPEGMTSYDVIRCLKRSLGRISPSGAQGPAAGGHAVHAQVTASSGRGRQKLKIGHAGTLDPFACGVLLVLTENSTKLCETLMSEVKLYQATFRFGVATDSGDITGLPERAVPSESIDFKFEQLQQAAQRFVGEIRQVPPMYSALRYGGRRLYELARKGLVVPRSARAVRVYSFRILEWRRPEVIFEAAVGRGVYVRSLAVDWAATLGSIGHLVKLTRLAIGPYHIKDSMSIEGAADFLNRSPSESWSTEL